MRRIKPYPLLRDRAAMQMLSLTAGGASVVLTDVEMPQGALFMSVDLINGIPTLSMLVDEQAKLTTRTFTIAVFGAELTEQCTPSRYRGSLQFGSMALLHVFDTTD